MITRHNHDQQAHDAAVVARTAARLLQSSGLQLVKKTKYCWHPGYMCERLGYSGTALVCYWDRNLSRAHRAEKMQPAVAVLSSKGYECRPLNQSGPSDVFEIRRIEPA